MKFERSAGILLHPTSFPGPYGIGDIGSFAYRWVDFLAETGCSLWQVLPLGPTGYGDSPYQSFSSFAGNPYLIDPQGLLEEGLLHSNDLVELPAFPEGQVDFGAVIPWKLGVLDRAYIQFQHTASPALLAEYEQFQQVQQLWLEDFALFMALKEAHGGAPWTAWEPPLRDRSPEALRQSHKELEVAVQRQIFRQFVFFRQWLALRAYANGKGVKIVGDIPIFVAHDSADVWANPELFYLDRQGNPTVVAGVPPDYFSPTGQLWGNPLYRWEKHRNTAYQWWLARIAAVLQLVDIIRLDHFRGFAGYWEVPAGMPTAEKGRWVAGPGADFFFKVRDSLGNLPIIAEDLGEITLDVIMIRDEFNLPGMKILQFAFSGDPEEKFLPHNYPRNCVAYTGTHDNDTALGWYQSAPEAERDFCRRYLDLDGRDVSWSMIRAVWSSVAMFALAPVQDLLSLGNPARMNFPGHPSGNWTWRLPADALSEPLKERLANINYLYGRKAVAKEVRD